MPTRNIDDRSPSAAVDDATIARPKGSASSVPSARLSNGFAEPPSAPAELLPAMTGAATHDIRYSTFVRERDLRDLALIAHADCFDPDTAGQLVNGKPTDPILDIFLNNRCAVMHLGYLASHRQRWISDGSALGELAYSLSLAPGESRSIATIDLRRRQQSRRQEDTDVNEQLISDQDHTFALQEVAAAVALEHQHGKTAIEANTLVTGGAFVAAGALVGGIGGGFVGSLAKPGLGTLAGAGVGAGAGAAAGGLVFAGAQAIGMIEAESSGDRDVMADTNQRIAQSTSQQSAMIRSLWSTVVTEDVQEEQLGVQTSNVTNYNHMHALNMQYFEVLHRYNTVTSVERVVPLIYVPFAAMDLDSADIVSYFWELIRIGLPEELQEQGDAVFVDPPPPDFVPEEVPAIPDAPNAMITGLQIDVDVYWDFELADAAMAAVPALGAAALAAAAVAATSVGIAVPLTAAAALPILGLAGFAVVAAAFMDEVLQDVNLRVRSATGSGSGMIESPRAFRPQDGTNRYRFTLPAIDAKNIAEVEIEFFGPTDLVDTSVDVRIEVSAGESVGDVDVVLEGFEISGGKATIDMVGGRGSERFAWSPLAEAQAAYDAAVAAAAQAEEDNIAGAANHDALLAQLVMWEEQVVDAVQRERYRFTKLILSTMESGRLTYLLDRFHISGDDDDETSNVPLHRVAHTTPLGVTDDGLVLRMKDFSREVAQSWIGTPENWNLDTESTLDIFELLMWPTRLRERFEALDDLTVRDVVHLPGAGVFAEAVLGRSNSAEYVDPERYWNWQDSPIPHQAPQILPVSTQPRNTSPLPSDPTVPDATIPLVSAPNFPDPVGLAGVLQAVQNGDMFRDMSKAAELTTVLGNLADLAGETAKSAATMTGTAASDALGSATDIGKTVAQLTEKLLAAAPSQAAGAPKNPTTAANASKAAENAESKPDDVKKAIKDAHGVPGSSPSTVDATPPPTPPWKPALDPGGTFGPGDVSNTVGGPTEIQERATAGLADLLDDAAANGTMPDSIEMLPFLEEWYRDSVIPLLVYARHNEEYLGSALAQYFEWLATCEQLGMDTEAAAMENLHGDARVLMRVGLEHAIDAAFGQMEANNDLGFLVDALNWVGTAQQIGFDSTDSDRFDTASLQDASGLHVVLDGALSSAGGGQRLTVRGGLAIGVNSPLTGHVVDVVVTVTNGSATPGAGVLHGGLDFVTEVTRDDEDQALVVEVAASVDLLQGVWTFTTKRALSVGA